MANPRVLLTGATGFIGRHLRPVLEADGWTVRCGSRHPERARREAADLEWVPLDVADPAALDSALQGCDAAVFLVHGMRSGKGYAVREERAARHFARAAAKAGVKRVVYLGGVAPQGAQSEHLRGRLRTGELLRGGDVVTVELRAAMVIGAGSVGWTMVHDLALRLPAMLLPRWMTYCSSPVALDDAVLTIAYALRMPCERSRWLELPGGETLSHRALLERVVRRLGAHRLVLGLPIVTPRLSSYWIALITRVDLQMARELVQGLQAELVPKGRSVWSVWPNASPKSLDETIRDALQDEAAGDQATSRAVVRILTRMRAFQEGAT